MVGALDGPGWWLGLNGVILVAYIVAIPANEIVIPAVLMLTALLTGQVGAGAGVMFEVEEADRFRQILTAGGWTALTGICLMIFSLCHNPCSTTIYTIWRETRSAKWTALATLMPFVPGVLLCAAIAALWRALF
jgi:ferrous iron transport protein B